MWIYLRIGVLYAAPALAVLAAAIVFAVLLRRVRRNAMSRARAARLYPLVLLLPLAAIVIVWLAGELSSYFAAGAGEFVWNAAESAQFLIGLLPLAGYVAVPIAVLVVAFWVTLASMRNRAG